MARMLKWYSANLTKPRKLGGSSTMTNPIANSDQFAAETAVVAMWQTDRVNQARAHAAQLFKLAYGCDSPQEALDSFDEAIDEYVTNYLFKAAASDVAYPRFVRNFMPAYAWGGRQIPGARMGGDNPDNCYRLAGIAPGGSYRVTGRAIGKPPASTTFTLTANYGTSVTVQTLDYKQLTLQDDGNFVITISDRPTQGSANHMTTTPKVKFLFVRDSFEDWTSETPLDMHIERIDPVQARPLAVEQMAERAAFRLIEEVPLYYWFQRLFSGLPVNSIRPPSNSTSVGGLVTQAGIQGWFRIAEDEVVLVRYRGAGADYASLELGDWWFRSIDAHRCQSTLTRSQSIPDDDGWITCVVARQDPGVANWLDTAGRETVLLFARWQGLPAGMVAGEPEIETRLIKLAALPQSLLRSQALGLPARAASLAARAKAWDRRTKLS